MTNSLWTKDFSLLFSGKFVSALGSFATSVAMGFFVLHLTGSATIMANVLAVQMFAFAVFLPFGGLLSDFLRRNELMFLSDFLRGIIVLVFAFLAFRNMVPLWFVFLTVLVIGLGRALMSPASDSLVTSIVEKKNIRKANSFLMLSDNFSSFAGNGVGGFLFQVIGAPLLFLFDGFTYLISGVSELFISEKRKPKKIVHSHLFKDIKEGFIFLFKNKPALSLAVFAGLANMTLTLAAIVLIPYFNESFTPAKYGFLLAIFALGAIVGSFIIGFIKNDNPRLYFSVGIIVFPLLLALAFLFNSFVLISIFVFIGLIFNGIVNNYIGGALQFLGTKDIRGRANASARVLFNLLRPIGSVLAGLCLLVISAKSLIVFAYIFSFFASLFFLWKTPLLDAIDISSKK